MKRRTGFENLKCRLENSVSYSNFCQKSKRRMWAFCEVKCRLAGSSMVCGHFVKSNAVGWKEERGDILTAHYAH